MNDQSQTHTIADLPKVGQPLRGGTFCGVATVDDRPVAVVLLPDRATPGLSWRRAVTWAEGLGAVLPSRQVGAMLAGVNVPKPRLCWLGEQADSMSAVFIDYSSGAQDHSGIASLYPAIAVRLVPIAGAADREDLERRIAAIETRFAAQSLGERLRVIEAHLATAA